MDLGQILAGVLGGSTLEAAAQQVDDTNPAETTEESGFFARAVDFIDSDDNGLDIVDVLRLGLPFGLAGMAISHAFHSPPASYSDSSSFTNVTPPATESGGTPSATATEADATEPAVTPEPTAVAGETPEEAAQEAEE